jgi:hypothetical protein
MAASNYTTGLQRQYARWLGERLQLTKDIKQIEEAVALLDEKKQRLARIAELTLATETLMSELDPAWRPEKIQPHLTNRQVLPWEHGATTSTAFEIIRELGEPISTLELAKKTIARLGSDPEDPDLLDRVRSNLDNSLRNHSAYIKNVGGRPSRWQIIPPEEMEMPKPLS